MIKSSKLLIDLLVPWTNHFMVCSMVCSGVLSWIDFFKSYLMILLKKLRFLFVKININISNLIFLPPHPPRRFPVQKVVPWPESEPATQLPTTWTDRAPSQEHCCLFCQVDGGWRPGWAWRKVICPVERTCLTLVASTSLQSLQFGSCIAAHELMVQLMTRRRPFFTERPSNAAKCTDNFRKPFDHFFIQNRGICCCLFNTIQVSTISSTTCNIFSTSRRFVLLCCCSRTVFVVHCISLSIPALTAQNWNLSESDRFSTEPGYNSVLLSLICNSLPCPSHIVCSLKLDSVITLLPSPDCPVLVCQDVIPAELSTTVSVWSSKKICNHCTHTKVMVSLKPRM